MANTLNKVNSGGIEDGSIVNADVKSDAAIDASKIAGLAASATTDTRDASNINSGTLPAARIGDESITLAKLEHGTGGNDGKFLRSNNGADPTWETVSSPKLDAPVITGTTDVVHSEAVSHTVTNYSDDVTYAFTPTNCTIGSVNTSGVFTVTIGGSGTPSYIVKATTDSLGLDDSSNTTKTFTLKLTAPTLSSPADAGPNINVAYTVTSTDTRDDKLVVDFQSSNFSITSVSHGSSSKVGNTAELTGFTTNNPVLTVQFTASGTYSVRAKAQKVDGSVPESAWSATDSITIADLYYAATGPDGAAGTTSGDYKYHKFTSTKTGSNGLVVSQVGTGGQANAIEYLIVAGGGGSSGDLGSGSGAGGYRLLTGKSLTAANHDVTVGQGGAGTTGNSVHGNKGSNSTFNGDSATGGGKGVYECQTAATHGEGGSGSGSSNCARSLSQGNEGGYSPVEGYGGGAGHDPGGGGRAGGGGGAGGTGGSADASNVGAGGVGSNSASTWATATSSGADNGYFAGGGAGGNGGGSAHSTGAVSGGLGGGGDTAANNGQVNATGGHGTASTGGGGAGGNCADLTGGGTGGNGGGGIIIVRYKFQN